MNVNGLLTKRWLSHLESNQNSGYQKPVCSRYTMGQAELRILYHISFTRRPGMCICHTSKSSASKNAFVLACMPGAFDSRGPATFNTNAEDIPLRFVTLHIKISFLIRWSAALTLKLYHIHSFTASGFSHGSRRLFPTISIF